MKRVVLLAAVTLAACNPSAPGNESADTAAAEAPAKPSGIWATAADRINVRGDLYAAENPKAIVLLFHQADSSREEYATLGPRLAAAGYGGDDAEKRGDQTRGHDLTIEDGGDERSRRRIWDGAIEVAEETEQPSHGDTE